MVLTVAFLPFFLFYSFFPGSDECERARINVCARAYTSVSACIPSLSTPHSPISPVPLHTICSSSLLCTSASISPCCLLRLLARSRHHCTSTKHPSDDTCTCPAHASAPAPRPSTTTSANTNSTTNTSANANSTGCITASLAAALAAAEATLELDRGWLPTATDPKPGISNDPVRALESGTAAKCKAGALTALAGWPCSPGNPALFKCA